MSSSICPTGRVRSCATKRRRANSVDLFERVGAELGMKVKAVPTDGSAPIGRGIGPALELRDVLAVLDNHQDAPADLREKALRFAGHILAWSPRINSPQRGREEAERILSNGAARRAFDRIVDAQGRQTLIEPSRYRRTWLPMNPASSPTSTAG